MSLTFSTSGTLDLKVHIFMKGTNSNRTNGSCKHFLGFVLYNFLCGEVHRELGAVVGFVNAIGLKFRELCSSYS